MQNVILKRENGDNLETLGILNVGKWTCKVLEKPWLDNQKNISCIPKGAYKITCIWSDKFKAFVYKVLNVPNRTDIEIHWGNFFDDSEGCILLGQTIENLNDDAEFDIANSRITCEKFMQLLGGQDAMLQII